MRPYEAWRTRDGRLIPIKKLAEAHLDSIIGMLERQGCNERLCKAALYFYANTSTMGEAAADCLEMEANQALDSLTNQEFHLLLTAIPVYQQLLREKKSRQALGEYDRELHETPPYKD